MTKLASKNHKQIHSHIFSFNSYITRLMWITNSHFSKNKLYHFLLIKILLLHYCSYILFWSFHEVFCVLAILKYHYDVLKNMGTSFVHQKYIKSKLIITRSSTVTFLLKIVLRYNAALFPLIYKIILNALKWM